MEQKPLPNKFAAVAVDVPVRKTFDYSVPEHLQDHIAVGMRVRVPFGRQKLIGYCVGLPEAPAVEKTKPITEILDKSPCLDSKLLELTRWIASYYYCSWGEAIAAALPAGLRSGVQTRTEAFVELNISPEEARTLIEQCAKRSPKQANILRAALEADGAMTLNEMAHAANCTKATVNKAVHDGALRLIRRVVHEDPLLQDADPDAKQSKPALTLTDEQHTAVQDIIGMLDGNEFGTVLLHGVTGSGKTEVYLRALARAVEQGKQGIVLVPEISLTPQTVRRFRARFDRVAVLHSHLTPADRNAQWKAISEGKADVVVGARSALFAPMPNLGLIVVDEEHENSFKQETSPRYHARDVAVMRAKIENIVCVLGSATPSLESYQNAQAGRYHLAPLTRRVEKIPMPPVEIIDMAEEMATVKYYRYISRRLENLIRETLALNQQVILFLNRRGFSTYIFCLRCKYVLKCKHCDISLTHHKQKNKAMCHYCHYEIEPPEVCPACGAHTLKYVGMGTERIEDEVKATFPGHTIARMDSDTMRQRKLYEKVLGDFHEGKTDMLVGTQMIAKGLHFPNVTLVGVISADSALSMPDFRASERTFQLIAQVAGRTGRGAQGGRVIVQAFTPEHYSIQFAAAHDYHSFVGNELEHRKDLMYPPYGRVARILLQAREETEIQNLALSIGDDLRAAGQANNTEILGPAPCPISRIKSKYRWHILLKAPGHRELRATLDAAEAGLQSTSRVAISVDVDALAML